MSKACTKCSKTKPLEEFYVHKIKGKVVGWQSWCKTCSNTLAASWRRRKATGLTRSTAKLDDRNPGWKGDAVGYGALHGWVRRRYQKPVTCESCHDAPPRDLANKSGQYLRDLTDWWYLCRRCHMLSDGRLERRSDEHADLAHI